MQYLRRLSEIVSEMVLAYAWRNKLKKKDYAYIMSVKLYFWQIRKRNKYQLEGKNSTPTQPAILLQSALSQTCSPAHRSQTPRFPRVNKQLPPHARDNTDSTRFHGTRVFVSQRQGFHHRTLRKASVKHLIRLDLARFDSIFDAS
jgi:hypothetical protein